MAEAVLLALTKIGNVLADEAAKAMVAKLSEKVNNLRALEDKVEQIRKQLTTMNSIIRKIGTTYLTDDVFKGWIGEVRKLAYRVEDVMDKYSYYSLQMEEEWFLKKYFIKGSHYVIVFSQIADEVVKIEEMFNSMDIQIPKLADLQMFNRMDLPWQLLEEITNGFSEERKIGSGGYGVVYKGVYKNVEEIAVKKLYHMPGLDEKQFQNELQNLAGLRHQNIVRLVGKCYEERERCVEHEGKLVCAKIIDRVICLEYLHNGSLENHLCDESSGLPWRMRYEIIKGICDGLKYLHERGIFHLDLKPTNILLDKNMVPKIADFGLSRLFSGTRQSHITSKFLGTLGYMPPEYIEKGKISNKFDVFSLGVIIIGIMTGPDGYSKQSDMSSQDFIEQVLENWRSRPQEQWKDESYFDVFCQLKICIEIALNCVETDRHKRPSIGDIICKLNESETMIDTSYKVQWLEASQLVHDPLTEMERQRSQDSFPELVNDEDLVGIEDNRKMLTEWLYSEKLDSTLITVSGMGGLGKTTLVTNVYEREKINFAAHAWMVVSQTYTVDALLRKLLRKVGYMEQSPSSNIDRMDVYDLKEEIKRRLKDRKCLIVLDDVWNQEVYFQMCDAFQNFQASRIIITTRKSHVAALAPSTRRLDLQPLGDTHAFDLFCRRAFYSRKSHECPNELMKVATSIVDRCQGLPLAIVSIGSLLSSRPRKHYVWNQTYNQLRCELSNNDHVRAILNLSYHDLSGDLRNCFLYCSLFPEDYPILRETLVRLWVAEGFVLSKENNTPEEVAEGNLLELIQRNMLKVTENDELGRVSTCTMHDIVRDLALSVAKEEKFGSANNYGTMIQMDRDVRRLSSCGWKDSTTLKVKLPRLRTLVSLGAISSSPAMLSSILSESTYLTVVELQDSEITEVPASIGTLFNLRYIGLRRTKVKSLPDSVEKLSNLHTLDIKQTKIEKLPRGIVKIKKLRHLLADRYADEKQSVFRYFIGIQAPKGLSNLEELQTLETVEASKDLAEQLKKLMQLRSVWIDNISTTDCESLFSTLSNMRLLSSLLLSAKDENEELCFETLKPRSTVLHKLIVRGQWAKGTLECPIFLGYGTHLKYLALSWCHIGEDPLGMLASHLPNLTYLRLNNMHSAKILVLSAGSFPHLKTLVLKHMPDVTQVKIMDGALPCIEGLYIVSLSEMDKVPQGIEFLRSLKKLWLLGLPKDFRTEWDKNGMHQKTQHVPEVRV